VGRRGRSGAGQSLSDAGCAGAKTRGELALDFGVRAPTATAVALRQIAIYLASLL